MLRKIFLGNVAVIGGLLYVAALSAGGLAFADV
jgi:hypothetical protein